MATWKKVIVSGSNISELYNDAGYLTSVTQQNAFVTASVNGVNLIADNSQGTLNFASSSGAGLNITGNSGTDTLTFTLGAIPNGSLTNSTITVTAGSGLTGGGSTALGSSTTVNVGAGTHITVNADDVAVNTTTLIPAVWAASGSYSGSLFTRISGDIAITAAGVATIQPDSVALGTDTTGNYVASITSGNGLTGGTTGEGSTPTLAVGAGNYITVNADDVAVNTTTLTPVIWAASGSYTGSIFTGITGDVTINAGGVSAIGTGVIVDNDVNASANIAYTKLNFGSSGFVSSSASGDAQGQIKLNGVNVNVTTLQQASSPQFVNLTLTGDAAVNGGDITTTAATATVFNTNATTVNAFGAATTLNLGAGTSVTTIGDDLIVNGDLTVKGDTTVINTQQLLIEDPFILLASGSTVATDAGILIDRGSDTAGNIAFGFDTAKDRFGFANGLTDTTSGIDTAAAGGVSGSFVPYLFTESDHGATKPVTGEFAVQGAMYMTTAGDFWIYA